MPQGDDKLPLEIADPPLATEDPALAGVSSTLRASDPDGTRMAEAIRRSFDMLLDGQNTGRYRWDQLHKTEKTHAGTVIEINVQREFGFGDGTNLDYTIAGVDVDCKYSQQLGAWMLPPEAVGEVCLLLWASDQESRWCAGLVRPSEHLLNRGFNRDQKLTLNKHGRSAVRWLHRDAPLPENILLHLPPRDIEAIMAQPSGQKKLNELFRRAPGRKVRRAVVETLGPRNDPLKRVRGNGGCRTQLRPEGYVILGDYDRHCRIAQGLGLPVPLEGEFVSARLARLRPAHASAPSVEISGERWTLATPDDPAEDAPIVPAQ